MHAYCLSYRFLNNVVITTIIEMFEMVEILDGRLGKRSVERVRYVINNLLHLVIVKYGDISLVLCISTRLRLVTILSLLVKYLVILHADPCNKSYRYCNVPQIMVTDLLKKRRKKRQLQCLGEKNLVTKSKSYFYFLFCILYIRTFGLIDILMSKPVETSGRWY